MGKISRWTPSLETSWPPLSPLTAILSISSIKIIPDCWTLSLASSATLSGSIIRSNCSSVRIFRASPIVTVFFFDRPPLNIEVICRIPASKSSMLPPAKISIVGILFCFFIVISTSLSSSLPSRSITRNFSLVELSTSEVFSSSFLGAASTVEVPKIEIGKAFSLDFCFLESSLLPGKSKSNNSSSTRISAWVFKVSCISAFTML